MIEIAAHAVHAEVVPADEDGVAERVRGTAGGDRLDQGGAAQRRLAEETHRARDASPAANALDRAHRDLACLFIALSVDGPLRLVTKWFGPAAHRDDVQRLVLGREAEDALRAASSKAPIGTPPRPRATAWSSRFWAAWPASIGT